MPPSDWSGVDAAADPRRLLTGLDALRADPFFAASKARISALLAPSRAARVVDVGCGTGDDAAALAASAIAVERSRVMCAEARVRHGALAIITADAAALPVRAASVDAVRADRVIQHLPDAPGALREWRRVLRAGGALVTFDPDLATAIVDGVDAALAAAVLDWRVATRPGAPTVRSLAAALRAARFTSVRIEEHVLDLCDLDRADGMMGLANWGGHAADAGAIARDDADTWADEVAGAAATGRLRYRCAYLLAVAVAG